MRNYNEFGVAEPNLKLLFHASGKYWEEPWVPTGQIRWVPRPDVIIYSGNMLWIEVVEPTVKSLLIYQWKTQQ